MAQVKRVGKITDLSTHTWQWFEIESACNEFNYRCCIVHGVINESAPGEW